MVRWRATDWTARVLAVPVFSVIALASSTLSVSAQTTVSLSNPSSDVVFATIRGGSYADRNLPSLLATRASSDPEYHRRALLKFDTHNRIPKGSTVTSALLTVTVKNGSEDSTRSIAAYQVTTSWNEHQVTWHKRRTAKAWMSAGGDFGSKLDLINELEKHIWKEVNLDREALIKRPIELDSAGSPTLEAVLYAFVHPIVSRAVSGPPGELPSDVSGVR